MSLVPNTVETMVFVLLIGSLVVALAAFALRPVAMTLGAAQVLLFVLMAASLTVVLAIGPESELLVVAVLAGIGWAVLALARTRPRRSCH